MSRSRDDGPQSRRPPALTSGEWRARQVRDRVGHATASVRTYGCGVELHLATPSCTLDFDRAEALIPLLNDALPDGHALKVTREHVAALLRLAYGECGVSDLGTLRDLASVLGGAIPDRGGF